MALLSIQNLNVKFKSNDSEVLAVNNVSFDIEQQDSVGIVGESGSGKSTLAMAILKLLPQSATVNGEAFFEGEDLLNLEETEFNRLRWKEIAVVFQKSMNALSPVHKIGEQLEDVYRLHSEEKESKSEVKSKIIGLLKKVNLPSRVYTMHAHELSGGMMQRVSIALSLIHNPKLLILDEATTALDVVTQRQIINEIIELEKNLKITRIMITHDMSVIATSCKKVAVMYAGNLLEYGLVSDILSDPQHPYTIGLLNSFTSADNREKELKGIPGNMPDLRKKRKGCIFAERCPISEEYCFEIEPETVKLKDGRTVSCHKVGTDVQ